MQLLFTTYSCRECYQPQKEDDARLCLDSLLVTLALILLKRIPRKIMETWTGIVDGAPLDNIDVPSTSGSSNLSNDDDHGRSEPISNDICLEGEDTESKFSFSSSVNPVMSLVAFLASALGPRVAAACAHVSLGSLSKESSTEGSPGGYLSQHDAEGATLSGEKVISAAEDGLTAAAMKATLFADHEEREIQWLSANIIDHQCGAPPHSTATSPSHRLFGLVDDAASLASPGGQRRSFFSQVLWSAKDIVDGSPNLNLAFVAHIFQHRNNKELILRAEPDLR
ncbi:SWI/SNF complex subunit SWI3C-like [Salvia divinorum]|uniref:SWI/SNF complex subunit SWI3C-like n=1 Tax=Salvia divinorum TaxID=28513 RepID=A0ABD1IET1_SALDI